MTKKYTVNELRRMFLEFFEGKEHLRLPSFSLIPRNDKSLLLINAGMAPMKPYFTGQETPPSKRVCTCQKCVRTADIENVGKTARHLTFFEMLGNFSFGDYFKEEAITWSWEFLTEVVGLDAKRLYPSIYFEDEEAFKIWHEVVGVPAARIKRFYRDEDGKCDNFWEHGAGPCGPSSEIYYDRGEKYGCKDPNCGVGCECDRFMEVWNNVFTQFEGDGKGHYEPLKQKNIDTGMGLERLAIVAQDVDTIFDIDTMSAIRNDVCQLSKKTYGSSKKDDISIRLITDHIRSSTFLIADGVMPSNEGRGYVLRRLIRRGARHGRLLGIEGAFLSSLCQVVINQSCDGYPELEEKKDFIVKVFSQEEKKFDITIDQGLAMLYQLQEEMKADKVDILSGEDAFRLYDTFGFPLDLTVEILEENHMKVDHEGFKQAMEVQRKMAKAARKTTNYMGADSTIYEELPKEIASSFVGYKYRNYDSEILALTKGNEIVDTLVQGEEGSIIVGETPFYATSGGQAADAGRIKTTSGEIKVTDTVKVAGNRIAHIGKVISGFVEVGEKANLAIDESNRKATEKNHSATHLLQKALRMVLGNHVEQSGSEVNAYKLRFDFSHFSGLTKEELSKVETMVNEAIENAYEVTTEVMSIDEAKKTGAMALFGEKYGDKVRIVRMGDFSTELCGGTHVKNTATIRAFKILTETGVAAGVRRIEALTGQGVFDYYEKLEKTAQETAEQLKTNTKELVHKATALVEDNKRLVKEIEQMKKEMAKESLGSVLDQVVTVGEYKFLAARVPNMEMGGLRELGDGLKDQLEEGVVVLASDYEGRVNLVAMATKGAINQGAHAGNLIKGIAGLVGGGGGGRPNMAQAGGKNPEGMDEALAKARVLFENQIG